MIVGGKTYQGFVYKSHDALRLRIENADSVVALPIADLEPELQVKLGYDQNQAIAQERDMAQRREQILSSKREARELAQQNRNASKQSASVADEVRTKQNHREDANKSPLKEVSIDAIEEFATGILLYRQSDRTRKREGAMTVRLLNPSDTRMSALLKAVKNINEAMGYEKLVILPYDKRLPWEDNIVVLLGDALEGRRLMKDFGIASPGVLRSSWRAPRELFRVI